MEDEEIKLLNYQLLALFLFLLSVTVSIVITYDRRQSLLHEQTLFSTEIDQYANLLNKFLILFIASFFVYANIKDTQMAKGKGSNLTPFHEQIIASILGLITSILVLDAVLQTFNTSSISSIENPIS